MYEQETILKLKEPRSTDEELFAYDRVQVMGQSPVHHGTRAEEWTGANGQGVIIQPLTEFGATVDEPYGKLQELYEVESLPERGEIEQRVKVVQPEDLGPSPEDVFAQQAQDAGTDSRRAKKPAPVVSPLDGEVQAPPQEPPVRGAEEEVAPKATE